MESRETLFFHRYASPCGDLLLGMTHDYLCLSYWMESKHLETWSRRLSQRFVVAEGPTSSSELFPVVVGQLDAYFEGKTNSFDLPLQFIGTDFQQTVWQALQDIPYGSTLSYQQLAASIGQPRSVRAVANAVAQNPLQPLVPCHRVVGADGSLKGYAGGRRAKSYLLSLEQNTRRLL